MKPFCKESLLLTKYSNYIHTCTHTHTHTHTIRLLYIFTVHVHQDMINMLRKPTSIRMVPNIKRITFPQCFLSIVWLCYVILVQLTSSQAIPDAIISKTLLVGLTTAKNATQSIQSLVRELHAHTKSNRKYI